MIQVVNKITMVLLIELPGRAAFPKPEETQPLTKWTLISSTPPSEQHLL
jgi:hypothetical protein